MACSFLSSLRFLPAKYSLWFKFFQLPVRSRSAITRIVNVVSRLSRAASADFSGWLLACSLRSAYFHFEHLNSSAMSGSALAFIAGYSCLVRADVTAVNC